MNQYGVMLRRTYSPELWGPPEQSRHWGRCPLPGGLWGRTARRMGGLLKQGRPYTRNRHVYVYARIRIYMRTDNRTPSSP